MRLVSFSWQVYRYNLPRQFRLSPPRQTTAITQQRMCLGVLLFLSLPHTAQGEPDAHPYRPCAWIFHNPADGRVIAQTVSNAPSFIVRLSDIFNPEQIGLDPQGKPSDYINWGMYWCPSSNPGKGYCAYPGYGFCGYWGCETIVTSNQWVPTKRDDFLDVTFWPKNCKRPIYGKSGMVAMKGSCSHLNITVLQPQDVSWSLGRKWSVFIHSWDVDPSTIVQIVRVPPQHHIALGPNQAVVQQHHRISNIPMPSITTVAPAFYDTLELTSHALFYRMLNMAFSSLNATKPDLTNSCWLCYDTNPPFYEGVALNIMFSYSKESDPKRCPWNSPWKGITLEQVSGKGICVGSKGIVQRYKEICNVSVTLDKAQSWPVPSASGIWACKSTGVTPCISIRHFDEANDFCVQVVVVPRILYYSDDKVLHHLEENPSRQNRELITATSLTVLLGLGATGTVTGASALVSRNQGLAQLQKTADEDLRRIQKTVSDLEECVDSLAEVALQNRRGLDLLLMHQGGLCAALNEKCCFYANKSGPIRQSLAELQQRREQRSRQFSQQTWFDSLFNQSLWITTLISTLAGPVIVVFALMFGPCLLNKLAQFVKARLSRIDVMYLEQRQLA
uniref:Envelope glycoprotein n=1 Tax=Catharus ustulatus TaxID=91951 RepID=A0A8C3TNH9_CATUS